MALYDKTTELKPPPAAQGRGQPGGQHLRQEGFEENGMTYIHHGALPAAQRSSAEASLPVESCDLPA